MAKIPLVVSFSGGRTSAFMCWYLIENFSDKYEFYFVFANTGREHEETLIFVERCCKYFGLNVVWVEGEFRAEHGVGPRHKVVDFKTASRNGEPFERLLAVEGIPNISRAKCSDYLKTQVIRSWMREEGLLKRGKKALVAIGMRADEPDRNSMDKDSVRRFNLVYPLSWWGHPYTKPEILTFWDQRPFNLYLPEHHGNCKTCFKKSDNKLFLIAYEHPEWFQWNTDMERKYGAVKAEEGGVHRWWRQKRTTPQLVGEALEKEKDRLIFITKSERSDPDGCGESCEPFSIPKDEYIRVDDDYLLSDDKMILNRMVERGSTVAQIHGFIVNALGIEATVARDIALRFVYGEDLDPLI